MFALLVRAQATPGMGAPVVDNRSFYGLRGVDRLTNSLKKPG